MIFFYPVEMLHIVRATQELHKILIVGDDEQLEVTLSRATLDDSAMEKIHILETQEYDKSACTGAKVFPLSSGEVLNLNTASAIDSHFFLDGRGICSACHSQ